MVVVFGTICLDRVHRVPYWPQPGGYTEIGDETLVLGGEAANTALSLIRWGCSTKLYGNALGFDAEAEIIIRMAADIGLPFEVFQHPKANSPVCDIYVTPDGERSMIGRGFSEMGDFTALDNLPLVPGEWFTAEPNCEEVAREAVRKAIAANMRIYLMDFIREDDPIPAGSFWQSSTDWAGTRGDRDASLTWVSDWSKKHQCHTIITDGKNGLYYSTPEGVTRSYPVFPCAEAVDATGAGDAFRAGVLFGLDQKWPIERCLMYGAASGSLACEFMGATTDIPERSKVEHRIEQYPEIQKAFC